MAFEWNRVPPQRERLLFLLVMAGIAFALFQALGAFGSKEHEAASRKQEALKMEKAALEKFIAATPQIKKKTVSGMPEDPKQNLLSGQEENRYKNLPLLLSRLTDSSFLQKVRLEGFSYQSGISEGNVVRVDFTFSLSGSFHEWVRYLRRLEDFPALFIVRDVIMSAGEGSKGLLKGEIHGRFFRTEEE